jgi:3-phosphoshikimate 1-carboxyvinyltransferase
MPEIVELIAPQSPLNGTIQLPASKSISNRIMILEAISNGVVKGIGYSDADDTVNLSQCLSTLKPSMNVGSGGTTLRFLLAFLAAKPGYVGEIYGSERLMERPIEPLIKALNDLGGDVSIVQSNGDKRIRIVGRQLLGGKIQLSRSESSQFASALLLVAPAMKLPLELELPDEFPSSKYLDMTIQLMVDCGFDVSKKHQVVYVNPVVPQAVIKYEIEKDWSAASYWFGLVSLLPKSNLVLPGLKMISTQADSIIIQLFNLLGVESSFVSGVLHIKHSDCKTEQLGIDVADFPDLFPTIAVVCSGLRLKCMFTGLVTLRVKESDRVQAICTELLKLNVQTELIEEDLLVMDARKLKKEKTVIFETYDDHRIAMACSILCASIWKVVIRDPKVVSKSYPSFWTDLFSAGLSVTEFDS